MNINIKRKKKKKKKKRRRRSRKKVNMKNQPSQNSSFKKRKFLKVNQIKLSKKKNLNIRENNNMSNVALTEDHEVGIEVIVEDSEEVKIIVALSITV